MKLTAPMLDMLRSIREWADPGHHLRGASEHGGSDQTLRALVARGLVASVFNPVLTEAGRAFFDPHGDAAPLTPDQLVKFGGRVRKSIGSGDAAKILAANLGVESRHAFLAVQAARAEGDRRDGIVAALKRSMDGGDPSLTEALFAAGFTHRPGRMYQQEILDAAGAVVFTGTAGDTWAWLKART